jgi:hypothetical protein
MRYSVNYFSPFFVDDHEGVNTHYFSLFEAARDLLYTLVQNGFEDAYLKDEVYQCSLYWDKVTGEFYWEG